MTDQSERRPPGRPKGSGDKVSPICVRLDPQLDASLRQVAREEGVALSEIVRACLVTVMEGSPVAIGQEWTAVRKIAVQQNAIGRNLNQLARAANQGNFPDRAELDEELTAMKASVEAMRDAFVRVAKRSRRGQLDLRKLRR